MLPLQSKRAILARLARSLLLILPMRSFCTLTIAAASLVSALSPLEVSAEDLFAADAAFLGDIDTSRAPPPTRARASELGLDGVLAFARQLSKKGLHSAALPFLRHAAEEAPGRAEIWKQLATTLEAAHRKDEAAAAFDRYLSLSGTAPSAWSPSAKIVRVARAEPQPSRARIALPPPAAARPVAARAPPRTPDRSPRAKSRAQGASKRPAKPASRGQINGMLEALGQL